MKIYFKIKKKEYSTIDSNNLTLLNYCNLINYINNDKNDIELSKDLISEFTNIPVDYINNLEEYSLILIDWSYYIKEINISKKIQNKYFDKYKLKDLNNIKFGNYIDIDYYFNMIDDDFINIIYVIALMLLPDDYNKEDLEFLFEFLKNKKVKDLISIYNYYISFRTNLLKNYQYLFETEPDYDDDYTEEEIEEIKEEIKEKSKKSWLNTAYMLTNDDITKVDDILDKNIFKILNYLGYLKEKNENIKNNYK